MLEAFGFGDGGESPLRIVDAGSKFNTRIKQLRDAHATLSEERARLTELRQSRSTVRIAAETDARQRGLGIAETDEVGRLAEAKVEDTGPADLRNTSLLKFMKMTMLLMEFSKSSVKSPTCVGNMPLRFGLGVVWGGRKRRLE